MADVFAEHANAQNVLGLSRWVKNRSGRMMRHNSGRCAVKKRPLNEYEAAIITATCLDVEDLAGQICRCFDKRSPLAFVSAPDSNEQRVLGLRKKDLADVRFDISSEDLPHGRDALKFVLQHRGNRVSDVGKGRLIPPGVKSSYRKSPAAVEMGLDLPFPLKKAFVAYIAQQDAQLRKSSVT
jgi:hypothetical protein